MADDIVRASTAYKELGINRGAGYKWDQKGILKPITISHRKFYKRSDIDHLKEHGDGSVSHAEHSTNNLPDAAA